MEQVNIQEFFKNPVSVETFLTLMTIPQNEEDGVLHDCCVAFFNQYRKKPADDIISAIFDLTFGLEINDPIKSGYIANLIGGFIEEYEVPERIVPPLLRWFDHIIINCEKLFERICEHLPLGERSDPEDFERTRIEVAPIFYFENRAWEALDKFYTVMTSVMKQFSFARIALKEHLQILEKIKNFIYGIKYIISLIKIDYEKEYLVIEPSLKRGFKCTLSNIENNFQLAVILDFIYCRIYQVESDIPEELLNFCFSEYPAPPCWSYGENNILFKPIFQYFDWKALNEMLTLPKPQDVYMRRVFGVFMEYYPWDIPEFSDMRVLLIQRPDYKMNVLGFCRSYSSFPPRIGTTLVYGEEIVTDWLNRFRFFSSNNSIHYSSKNVTYPLNKENPVENIRYLPLALFNVFAVRNLRRLMPVCIENWGSLPRTDLRIIVNTVAVLENLLINNFGTLTESFEKLENKYPVFEKANKAGYCNQIVFNYFQLIYYVTKMMLESKHTNVSSDSILYLILKTFEEVETKEKYLKHELESSKFIECLIADYQLLNNEVDKMSKKRKKKKKDSLYYHDFELQHLGNFLKSKFWSDGPPLWWPIVSEYAMDKGYEYEVAISFAGENRNVAEELFKELTQLGCRVFYDKNETAQLLGKNLIDHLYKVYNELALFTVLIVSKEYSEKVWTRIERQAAQDRALFQDEEYILPVKLDDTRLPGLPRTIGYLDARQLSTKEIAKVISEKLRLKFISENDKRTLT